MGISPLMIAFILLIPSQPVPFHRFTITIILTQLLFISAIINAAKYQHIIREHHAA
jgi:hypothetical protein